VFQHTPLAITFSPSSLEIFPPLIAPRFVIKETDVVTRTGGIAVASEVKETCCPYPVPPELVA